MKSLSDFFECTALIYAACVVLVASAICAAYFYFVGFTLTAIILIALILILAIASIINFVIS